MLEWLAILLFFVCAFIGGFAALGVVFGVVGMLISYWPTVLGLRPLVIDASMVSFLFAVALVAGGAAWWLRRWVKGRETAG